MKVFLSTLALLLLAGCTTHGRIGALPEVPTPSDAAQIVVIREWRFTGSARTYSVTLDGAPTYGVNNNEHVVLNVPAGYHIVGVGAPGLNEGTASVQTVAQHRYYFRAEAGFYGPHLQPIGEAVGRELMAKTTLIQEPAK